MYAVSTNKNQILAVHANKDFTKKFDELCTRLGYCRSNIIRYALKQFFNLACPAIYFDRSKDTNARKLKPQAKSPRSSKSMLYRKFQFSFHLISSEPNQPFTRWVSLWADFEVLENIVGQKYLISEAPWMKGILRTH